MTLKVCRQEKFSNSLLFISIRLSGCTESFRLYLIGPRLLLVRFNFFFNLPSVAVRFQTEIIKIVHSAESASAASSNLFSL